MRQVCWTLVIFQIVNKISHKMRVQTIIKLTLFLITFLQCFQVFMCSDLTSVASIRTTQESKNHVYPENYEDVGGDFKKPGAFLRQFESFGHLGFIHGFVAAVSVIIVSEIGDKTFFIAAILAMRHSRITVFLGAMSALTIMTILSACLGFATTIIPRAYTHYISTALFAIFGLKMLKEGYSMSPDEGQEEYEEVQKSLLKHEINEVSVYDIESGLENKNTRLRAFKRKLMVFVSRIFLESFTMTFLAEWGDRSQLTTIILAAREDAFGVTLGAVLGHGLCTTLAVVGGRIIAQRISVRSVTFIGGIVFLLFAMWALIAGPGS